MYAAIKSVASRQADTLRAPVAHKMQSDAFKRKLLNENDLC